MSELQLKFDQEWQQIIWLCISEKKWFKPLQVQYQRQLDQEKGFLRQKSMGTKIKVKKKLSAFIYFNQTF